MQQPTDLDIARNAKLVPILELAQSRLGLKPHELVPYGHDKAKVRLSKFDELAAKPNGKLVLVTAMSPTPAGEGKTTTVVGLLDGLNRIGKKAMACLREPSLGPCFGSKGGAAGGGYAQVVPMEDINLHFTGDMHAISSANNLLAAMIDNSIYWDNPLRMDPRRVLFRRVVDMNDRELRYITAGLGGATNGFPREAGFDITVASEVMAVFCLSKSVTDLKERLGNITVALKRDKTPIFAKELKAQGAMAALLKDALAPNLVQTLENNPVFIHGGPFANIAHGCNSILATQLALKLSDVVVTEAGFGADLGAEKFFDIKCRKAGLTPSAAVIVATLRALKMHGGVAKPDLNKADPDAVMKGFPNLARHIENVRKFGVPVVVAVNKYASDTDAEWNVLRQECAALGVKVISCTHFSEGGKGAEELAREVIALTQQKSEFKFLYPDDMKLWDKIRTIAQNIYGAQGVIADKSLREEINRYQDLGYGHFPICMAKTPNSFSTDPKLLGAPSNHVVPIREVRVATGAQFLVVICGEIMTMPGLPRVPSAEHIDVDDHGFIQGLS